MLDWLKQASFWAGFRVCTRTGTGAGHPGGAGLWRRGVVRWLLARLLLALLGLAAPPALALEHITEQAWLQDPSGQLDLAAVQALPWQPFEGVLSRGYGAAPVWMRLRIDPGISAASEAGPLFLRVRPAYLDSVWLHDPLQGTAPLEPLGDRHRPRADDEPGSVLLWRLPRGDGPRDIWLRLRTTSTRLAHVEVLDERHVRRSNARIDHMGALYLGLMVMFVLWGLVQVLIPLLGRSPRRPDGLVLRFLVYKLLALGCGAGLLGYTRFYAPAWWPPLAVDLTTSLLGIASSWAVLLFSQRLLDELEPARWRLWLLRGLVTIYPVLLLLALTGQVRLALEVNMLLILLIPPLLLAVAVGSRARRAGSEEGCYGLSKSVVVLYLTLTSLFTLLAALPALGWLPGSTLSLYVVLFYSMASGLLMVGTLQYRSHRLQTRQVALVLEAQRERGRAEQERRQRLEREELLDMLGHELRTPLATVRMLGFDQRVPAALGQRIGAAVKNMSQVIERVVQTGRLDNGVLSVQPEPVDLPALLGQVMQALPEHERVRCSLAAPGDDATRVTLPCEAGDTPGVPLPLPLPGMLLPVLTDPLLLGLVLRNLLDNALKYSPAHSLVQVVLVPPDLHGRWSLTVANEPGRAGWPDPARLFQKYYRSPAAGHRSGSGLGLYLVKGVTQRLGGQLRYQPDGQWVRFVLFMGTGPEKDQ